MNIREQFGKYLLLKKLAEDPFGETFRAARVGTHGMEQVVLLRVFNGPGVDAATLTASLNKRREVQKALVSPNVGNGVDLGEVRGVPYVAYDYISGKDLAALQEQAKKRNHPIPSDHALLIAERIALALAVGYETRLEDERVLHGCAIPQLVMISNEGETRLLGFEAAPGLRQVVRNAAAARPLIRYLSPEARAGHPPHKSDDVYTLGVILLELLTGQALPADTDFSALIDGAELQSEGMPLPEDLKRLLKQSLTTQERRAGDVITWHKSLSRMMFEGQYNPTTFNLAFFMHNLFRDEIEKESREIEVEKTMELPVTPAPRPAPVAAAAAAPVSAPTFSSVREPTGVVTDTGIRQQRAKGRTKLVIGSIAALLLVGAGITVFLLMSGKDKPAAAPAQAAAQPPAAPPVATPDQVALEAAAAAQQAEAQRLEQLYQEMIDKQGKELEARYQQQLEALRKEMDQARQRAAEANAAVQTPPATTRREEPAVSSAQAAATQPPLRSTQPPAAPPVVPAATVAAAPPPPEATAAVPAPTLAAAPAIRPGDLVGPGGGATPPRLLVKPRPSYPVIAQRMRKEAIVVVRVLVDENGRVETAELKGKEVGFGFDHEAIRAARSARFTAATKGGVAVKMWVDLPIDFKL
jgi:serine/threonine-protein kinase